MARPRTDRGPAARLAALALALAAGCGGGGAGAPADGPTDGRPCADCDGAPACPAWILAARPARALDLFDEQAPLNGARTFRVLIEYRAGDDELPAMPDLVRGAGTLTITPRVFAPRSTTGAALVVRRLIVPLVLPPGTWQLVATAPTPLTRTVTVAPPPARPCHTGIGCAMDCDCDEAAGERCLSGTGLGGGFSSCARPCELDRDCGGRGTCTSIPDGLAFTCHDQPPECGPSAPCPIGFTCAAGACAPSFALDSATRRPCACDGDCAPGLRCVTATPATPGRCQATCPTGGPWCQGAHACGPAAADASGLATTDSVCGWLGE